MVFAPLGIPRRDHRRRCTPPPGSRSLLHWRLDRVLDHHEGLVAVPHHGEQHQPEGGHWQLVQLLEPDVVVVHFPLLREECARQSSETFWLAHPEKTTSVEAGVVFLSPTLRSTTSPTASTAGVAGAPTAGDVERWKRHDVSTPRFVMPKLWSLIPGKSSSVFYFK